MMDHQWRRANTTTLGLFIDYGFESTNHGHLANGCVLYLQPTVAAACGVINSRFSADRVSGSVAGGVEDWRRKVNSERRER